MNTTSVCARAFQPQAWARPWRARLFSSTSRVGGRSTKILALETSCDDTCASVVSSNREVLSNVVVRQDDVHEKWGGIHPWYAVHKHQRNMPMAIKSALAEAGLAMTEVDAVAFTRGPGMNSSLSVGAVAARSLAAALNKPLIGVHHMQAHALTPLLTEPTPPEFPFLTLLISGGHTMLVLARSWADFKVLATTLDDSIGDAFDKACRDLALPWSIGDGTPGRALERFAAGARLPSAPRSSPTDGSRLAEGIAKDLIIEPFPSAVPGRPSFSFAGLKSALRSRLTELGGVDGMTEEALREVARRFQGAAVGQLEEKLALALKKDIQEEGGAGKVRAVVVSGGVASNAFLRERLRKRLDSIGLPDLPLMFPPVQLCTDNAAMIGWVAQMRYARGLFDSLDVEHRAKWSLEDLRYDQEKPCQAQGIFTTSPRAPTKP